MRREEREVEETDIKDVPFKLESLFCSSFFFCQFVQSTTQQSRSMAMAGLVQKVIKATCEKWENVQFNGWNFYIFMSFMYLRMIYLKKKVWNVLHRFVASSFLCLFATFANILFPDPDGFFPRLASTCFYFIISGLKQKTVMKISGSCYRGFSVHSKA